MKRNIICFLLILSIALTLCPAISAAVTYDCPICNSEVELTVVEDPLGNVGCGHLCYGTHEIKIASLHTCESACQYCGVIGDHKYDKYEFDVTEEVHGHICQYCNEMQEAQAHYGELFHNDSYQDDEYHYNECDVCFTAFNKQPHNFGEDSECDDCGYIKEETPEEEPPAPPQQESWQWKYDANYGSLTISGSGAIPEFPGKSAPWIAEYQNKIYSIIVDEGITEIGNWAFSYLYYARSLKLPASLKKIGTNSFYYCMNLEQITLPESLEFLGSGAFAYCKKLGSISVPSKVTKILGYTFYDCPLKNIYYAKTAQDWQKLPKGSGNDILGEVNLISDTKAGIKWKYNVSTATLTISGVGRMDNYTAKNTPWQMYSDKIKKIVVEEGVTSIGNYAFGYCSRVSDVDLPESLTLIGSNAFYKCLSLRHITIPRDVNTIFSGAFAYCKNLQTIIFPTKIKTIHKYTFIDCVSLKAVSFPGPEKDYYNIDRLEGNDKLLSVTVFFG